MQYFIYGIAALVLVLLGIRLFVRANPAMLARRLRTGTAVLLTLAGLALLARGALALAMPVLGFAIMLFTNSVPGFGGGRPSPGQKSSVTTDHLEMELDIDSGEMQGRVIGGPHAGSELGDLDLADLLRIWRYYVSISDQSSQQLIEAYLERVYPEWREQGAAADDEARQSGGGPVRGGAMTREEAFQILGVPENASADEIRSAHRRLMKQYHPDHGGSDYLAAKINEAKDLLLGSAAR